MKAALELLKKDLEHYGNHSGELDGISFTIVAHLLRVFIKRIELQEGVPGAGKPFNIGDHTMSRVFLPNGITNVSDLQTVFDAIEKALTDGTEDAFLAGWDARPLASEVAPFIRSNMCALYLKSQKIPPSSPWKEIAWNERINFDTDENMVLIRKRNGRFNDDGKPCYHLEMAYRTVSGYWLTGASQPVGSFEEWMAIPQ